MKLNKFLIIRFLLALASLWVAQLLFGLFYPHIFNLEAGEWLGVIWGNVRYGLATVATFLLPYLVMMLIPTDLRWKLWYRAVAETLYVVPMLAVLGFDFVDCAYYQFTYRRMSYEFLAYLSIGGDMGNLLPLFVRDYWPVVVSGLGVMAMFVVVSFKMKLAPKSYYGTPWAWSVAGLLLCFVMVRGGFGRHFIQLNDAAKYCQMKNTSLVLNTPYCILRTLGSDDVPETRYMDSEEAAKIFDADFASHATLAKEHPEMSQEFAGSFAPNRGRGRLVYDTVGKEENRIITSRRGPSKNIVVIVLESFSQEYMGCYNHGIMESFTPFLDSLCERSLVLDGRSNGKKSIDAIPAIFASIPSLQEMPFIMSSYFGDTINALPQILQRNGYHTAFFHGSYNGSMNFDKFCQKAGFQEYYGRNEYGNEADYDNAWGIFDEPFLQYAVNCFGSFPEPFFSGIFTISSHHPYGIPEQHKGEFKTGCHPLLQCVNYTDYALRQFFRTAEQQPWYGNTLFVILADHPGQGLHREYNDYDGWYDIPMIVFDPSSQPDEATQQRYRSIVMQQIDVMPTLLDYLGIEGHYVCFGQSLWQRKHDFQVAYGNYFHQILLDGQIAAISGSRSIGDEDRVRFLKAYLQVYSERMRDNQLTITK